MAQCNHRISLKPGKSAALTITHPNAAEEHLRTLERKASSR